jgi:hypothetical protein
MKENTKLILVAIIAVVVSSTISITATTMIQANSVSYKTSNGDTTDVNSALDRLFDLNTVNEKIGSTNISSIGNGTITGAISELNSNLSNYLTDFIRIETIEKSFTVAANSTTIISGTVEKIEGYTPLLILYSSNYLSSNAIFANNTSMLINDDLSYSFALHNISSNNYSNSGNARFFCIYVKNM